MQCTKTPNHPRIIMVRVYPNMHELALTQKKKKKEEQSETMGQRRRGNKTGKCYACNMKIVRARRAQYV